MVDRDAPCWSENDEPRTGLRITGSGLAALGIEDERVDGSAVAGSERSVEIGIVEPLSNGASQDGLTEDEAADDDGAVLDQPSPATPSLSVPRPGSKRALVLALLRREAGASLDELVAATGWLPHTTRAALTGLRRNGHALTRTKDEGRTLYRIAEVAAGSPDEVEAAAEVA